MKEQTIIAVGREFGSGGHEIAEKIARDLGLKFYDRNMLDEIAAGMNIQVEILDKYDEQPRNIFNSRRVGKFSNSMEEILAEIQFDLIRKKAEEGESFVIVGRCSDSVLRGMNGLITIFVSGDKGCKTKRIMRKYRLNETDAIIKMERHDRKRKKYHNRYSDGKWGDSRYYDICINSSPLEIDRTVDVLEYYIDERTSAKGAEMKD